jgi:hypothetical protein
MLDRFARFRHDMHSLLPSRLDRLGKSEIELQRVGATIFSRHWTQMGCSLLISSLSRAMLFSKAILLAEWKANAPLREAMAVKRERWRARRAAIERAKQKDPPR